MAHVQDYGGGGGDDDADVDDDDDHRDGHARMFLNDDVPGAQYDEVERSTASDLHAVVRSILLARSQLQERTYAPEEGRRSV